jgi:hypothetical protein
MMRRRRLALAVFASLALLPLACRRGAPAGPPNVLLVVWDTVRADHLSLYGYTRPTTPRLDAFARDARVFDDCVSVGSTTVPAHASIFTGLLPSEHGLSNQAQRMHDSFVTLPRLSVRRAIAPTCSRRTPTSAKETGLWGFDLAGSLEPAYRQKASRSSGEARTRRPGNSSRNSWSPAGSSRARRGGSVARDRCRMARSRRGRPFFAVPNYMERTSR